MRPVHRILLLSSVGALGGAECSLLQLASTVNRNRFEPVLVTIGDGPLCDAARANGVTTIALPVARSFERTSLRARRSGLFALAAGAAAALPLVQRVRALIRDIEPSIVHTNGNKAHVVGTAAALATSAAVVWHVRDFLLDRPFERILAQAANRRTAAIVTNSAAVGACCTDIGFDMARVHVIPNGIDCRLFSPDGAGAGLRRECGWPDDARLVITVGALAPWKGHDLFLDAAAAIHRSDPSTRFLIVGSELYVTDGHGGYADVLRRQAAALGLERVVRLAGQRRDMPAVLRDADVVVHVPREPEPFGRVVAEAMACGRPVVTILDGGIAEIAGRDRVVGAVADRTPDALAAAVLDALRNPQASAQAARGRQRIIDHFTADVHARRIEAVYESVIASPLARAAAHVAVH